MIRDADNSLLRCLERRLQRKVRREWQGKRHPETGLMPRTTNIRSPVTLGALWHRDALAALGAGIDPCNLVGVTCTGHPLTY